MKKDYGFIIVLLTVLLFNLILSINIIKLRGDITILKLNLMEMQDRITYLESENEWINEHWVDIDNRR